MKDNQPIINDQFIRNVLISLNGNQAVRIKFPEWGRLHIDRRLPFLCIYRRPAQRQDKGTERLLLGQASYILIREEDAESAGFKKLLKSIVANLLNDFGSFLLFELWSGETEEIDEEEMQPARFTIKTTKQHVPHVMLEELESALLEIPIENRKHEVQLDYCIHCEPLHMSPLLSCEELSCEELVDAGCFRVGLNTTPIYRRNGELLPYILRQLHHWLTQALRRSLYTFIHQYTKHKPSHFNELGRHSMTRSVWETDKQLAQIKEQFDMLFHVTPVNNYEAWLQFKENGFTKTPVFNYRPRPIDPDLLKRQLYKVPVERIEDPTLAQIFRSQRDEIDRQLTMVNDRNTSNFLYGSLQVYGGVEPWLLELAKKILNGIPQEQTTEEGRYLSADEFAERAEQLLSGYRQEMPQLQSQIEIRDDIPGILVSRGNLMIGRHSRFSEDRVEATLAHEVGTHIVTYLNGKAQPFHQFYSGMANYESLQEGIAVLAEYLVGGLKPQRLRGLAARVIAVHSLIKGADFVEVFRTLHLDFGFSSYLAYFITLRVFRGGGFTKDAVYLKGFSQLLDYLGKGGELEILYLGKIAQENIPFVEELRWRKVLKEGALTPHYLKTEQGKRLLKTVRNGMSVLDLIEGNNHEIRVGS